MNDGISIASSLLDDEMSARKKMKNMQFHYPSLCNSWLR